MHQCQPSTSVIDEPNRGVSARKGAKTRGIGRTYFTEYEVGWEGHSPGDGAWECAESQWKFVDKIQEFLMEGEPGHRILVTESILTCQDFPPWQDGVEWVIPPTLSVGKV